MSGERKNFKLEVWSLSLLMAVLGPDEARRQMELLADRLTGDRRGDALQLGILVAENITVPARQNLVEFLKDLTDGLNWGDLP